MMTPEEMVKWAMNANPYALVGWGFGIAFAVYFIFSLLKD